MNSTKDQTGPICHVVAVPYPGRGHINPMMNLCKLLTSQKTDILITFVVTEEWSGFIGSEVTPDNIRLTTIPNVVPSELVRAADMYSFIEAIMTKMEAPFERLMDRLEPPPSLIVADTFLPWAVRVGNRRSIPAASFWAMPASFFSFFQHFHLLADNGHFPVDLLDDILLLGSILLPSTPRLQELVSFQHSLLNCFWESIRANPSDQGNKRVSYITGVSSTRLAHLPQFIYESNRNILA